MMVEYSTVQLHCATKDQLGAMRLPGESFDALVQRLLTRFQRSEEAEFLAELDAMYLDHKNIEPLK